MSITNVKDIDYMICMSLSERDFLTLSKTNKYYHNLYKGEEIWKRKLYALNIELDRTRLGKVYYDELISLLSQDFVTHIFNAINEERLDILDLLFKKKDLNPNYDFIFGKFYKKDSPKVYYSTSKFNTNWPIVYSPISLILKTGSYALWNWLKNSKYPLEMNKSFFVMAIASKNIEVLRDLIGYMAVEDWILYFAIRSYNEEATSLLLKSVDQEITNSVLDTMLIENNPEHLTWMEIINPAFHIFIRDVKVQSHLRFFLMLGADNVNFMKLLNTYNF